MQASWGDVIGAYHVTIPEAWQCHAGKVRKECVEGLRRVVGLHRVEWARQVDSLSLLPTCLMLNLLDKKFGGELTKEDVQVSSFNPETPILHIIPTLGIYTQRRLGTVTIYFYIVDVFQVNMHA